MTIKREYKHGTHVRSRNKTGDDLHVIKEHLHHSDGTITNNLKLIENYKRPFYITRSDFRDHEQKKEYTEVDKVEEFTCTQSELPNAVFTALNGYRPSGWVSKSSVNDSPYVYGTDISSTSLINHEYKRVASDVVSRTTLGIMDYETDVLNGTNRIISGSFSQKKVGHIAVTRSFLGPESHYPGGYEKCIRAALDRYLGDIIKDRKMEIKITVHENDAAVSKSLLKTTHEADPDILGFWNMPFDIGKILKAFELNGDDPADYFSSPKVPAQYRYFNWREASMIKVTADKKQSIRHIADLWHVVTTPAGFHCIDLMCLFKGVRGREQNRNSYSLDSILKDELNITKLKFDAADGLVGLDWHRKLQKEYKLEYLVYNLFDCISVEMLDEHTNDVGDALLTTIGISDLPKMNSNPRRLNDDLDFEMKANGLVIGSTGSNMSSSLDELTPSKDGWIITLAPELRVVEPGALINDYPSYKTNITTYAYDIDISSSYPNGGIILNISNSTRALESCGFIGLTDIESRSWGINISGTNVNSVRLAQMAMALPSLDTLLAAFEADLKAA